MYEVEIVGVDACEGLVLDGSRLDLALGQVDMQ